jgi:hypothetical protein
MIAMLVMVPSAAGQQQVPSIGEGIRPDQMANLAAMSLTPSIPFPTPGEQVDIAIEVRNRTLRRARNVALVLLAGTQQIASTRIDVEANSTATIHLPWRADSRATERTLTAVVDPAKQLTEQVRLDNVVSADVVIAPPPPPEADLAVRNVEFVAQPGRPGRLRAVINNNGSVAAQAPLVLRVDQRAVTVRLVGPVAARTAVTVEVPWSAESPPAVLSAEINPRFRAGEKNATDNLLSRDLRPSVDLRIEGLSVSTMQFDPRRPRQITMSFRIVNAGRAAIMTPFRTSIFPGATKRSSDDVEPRRDTYYVNTMKLEAGKTVYLSHTALLPANEFDVRVEADSDHLIREDNETNNIVTSHFKNPTPDVGRWVSIGPTRMTHDLGAVGRLHRIAINPKDRNTIYVGALGSGLWKTSDGGSSWFPLTDGLPTLTIRAIAVDPMIPSRVYIGTPLGIYRSEDAGSSWDLISTDPDLNIGSEDHDLLIHPTSPNLLYLSSANGVLRSSDGGEAWDLVLAGGQALSLLMDPANPSRLYATLYGSTDLSITGIYETSTGGATVSDWRKLTGCPGARLPVISQPTSIKLALSGGRLYASHFSVPPDGDPGPLWKLYRTTDIGCSVGGRSEQQWQLGWSPNEAVSPTLWSGLYADPTDPNYLYATGTEFWVSTNGGMSFSVVGGPHVDHHGFTVDPVDPKIIYALSDGGIYRSSDRGKSGTWQSLGEGIANVEFYDITNATTEPNLVIGGTQDNGTIRYDGSSTVWTRILGGDGATVAIDPTNAQVLYAMHQYPESIKRKVGTGSWQCLGCGFPLGSVCFNFPYQLLPTMPSTMLASCDNSLWRAGNPTCSVCPNSGTDPPTPGSPQAWQRILTPMADGIVRSAVDPTVNLYYAGSGLGRLHAGPGGANWQSVFSHRNSMGVTDIEVDPDDPTIVYASFSGTSGPRVYRLKRLSATPTAATMSSDDITSDLPSGLWVSALAVDRMAPFTLYAGTINGVYRGRSGDGGQTWSWTPYNNGLPIAVNIVDLEIHPTTGAMRAATFGRSAFEVNTDFPVGSLLVLDGKITLLRVHDQGTGYGPSTDQIDVEVVIQLDSQPGKAFGFQLRNNSNETAHRGMLDLLRDAFKHDRPVRIDYVRTGLRNGRILRVY